jgi:hypothetical protein
MVDGPGELRQWFCSHAHTENSAATRPTAATGASAEPAGYRQRGPPGMRP